MRSWGLCLPSHQRDGLSWNSFVVSDFCSSSPAFVFVSLRAFLIPSLFLDGSFCYVAIVNLGDEMWLFCVCSWRLEVCSPCGEAAVLLWGRDDL